MSSPLADAAESAPATEEASSVEGPPAVEPGPRTALPPKVAELLNDRYQNQRQLLAGVLHLLSIVDFGFIISNAVQNLSPTKAALLTHPDPDMQRGALLEEEFIKITSILGIGQREIVKIQQQRTETGLVKPSSGLVDVSGSAL